jgi:hypothetical protein
VGDGVDDRLEGRRFTELGMVLAGRVLGGGDRHVAAKEGHRVADLLVEGSGDSPGVGLGERILFPATVAHGFDRGSRKVRFRPPRGERVVDAVPPSSNRCLESLGGLWTRGIEPDWPRLHPSGGRLVTLPTYPFQRRSYWLPDAARSTEAPRPGSRHVSRSCVEAVRQDRRIDRQEELCLVEQPVERSDPSPKGLFRSPEGALYRSPG